MKNLFVLTTVLAIAMQVVVNAQTQSNLNFLTPTVKRGNLANSKKTLSSSTVVNEKTGEAIKQIEVINLKIEELNLQLNELQTLKQKVNAEIVSFFDENAGHPQTVASSVSLNIKREELIKQAEEMLKHVEELSANPNKDSKVWLEEKIKKENIAYSLLIEASTLKGKENEKQFSENSKLINEYINAPLTTEKEFTQASSLQREAERHMRIAKQLRKEASELESLLLTYSALGNAEEKEEEALQSQKNAIKLFNNHICVVR